MAAATATSRGSRKLAAVVNGAPARAPRKPRAPRRFNGTREEWLEAFTEALRPDFKAVGAPLPKRVKVSCGFASSGIRSKTIGECWVPEASAAGVPEVFIVPRIADSLEVAAILLHELVHAAGRRGHGAEFKQVATALGLQGKMTSTVPGPDAAKRLGEIVRQLGPYPHAVLSGTTSAKPKQGTRMLKVSCTDCPCVLRMTRTHLDGAGLPTCGCGGAMEEG